MTDAFLHCNDLSYTKDPETELKNYKIGDNIKVKSRDKRRSAKDKSWSKTNSKRSIWLLQRQEN